MRIMNRLRQGLSEREAALTDIVWRLLASPLTPLVVEQLRLCKIAGLYVLLYILPAAVRAMRGNVLRKKVCLAHPFDVARP